ncbi:MAG: trypsin-like peptidase domain-containing protein [Planctomycetes bacterium]|nr:trypsin-like peptidase domain-containing protein [Planctomycetota bacterium]
MMSLPKPAVLALLVAACGAPPTTTTSPRDLLAERNAPLRAASVAPFAGMQRGDLPLLRFLADRTALVVDGATGFSFVTDPATQATVFRGTANGKVVTKELGAGVPITDDGYFLTAAHCLQSGAALVVGRSPSGAMREVVADVVWNGAAQQPPTDLAVLWAPGLGVSPLALAPATPTAERGTPVVVCGSGASGLIVAGGSVEAFARTGRELVVNVPVLPGDSGGPCATTDGAVLGIVSTAHMRDGTTTATVLVPDRAWLDGLLAEHRTRRGPAPTAKLSAAGTVHRGLADADLAKLLPPAGR